MSPANGVSETGRVTRAAGIVGLATLASRILGFFRDMAVAGVFGAGMGTDAFFVAFRIPNLLRRLFAEGSLTVAFIPVFTKELEKRGRAGAFLLAGSAFRLLAFVLVFVVVVGMAASPWIVWAIAPGFAGIPEKFELTVFLTRMVFPYVFTICLVALCMGVLNVFGMFTAPALAPVMLNGAIIAAVFWLSPRLTPPVLALGVGVLLGGGLQLLLQLPFLRKTGFRFRGPFPWIHPGIVRIARLMIPSVVGAAVYQVNVVVGTLLASLLPEGSVSYLYYADRLVQFPLGLFGVAAATAVLPSLSRQAAAGDLEGMKETFVHTLRLVVFVTLPAAVGLIVLREPIVALLFQRGAFEKAATQLTAEALLYYSLGLWAFSSVRIVVSVFYAQSDTTTPVKAAAASIAANIGLGVLLMGPLQHGGLALATSLASMVNLVFLVTALYFRIGGFPGRMVVRSIARSLAAAIVMGVAVAGVSRGIAGVFGPPSVLPVVGIGILTGVLVYAGLHYLMKSPEFTGLIKEIQRRKGA